MNEIGRRTRGQELIERLFQDILSGELPPGARLDEQKLAERYEVSRTPVREALRQLASAGLVTIEPHRGALVAQPNAADLRDGFEAMRDLEGLCARYAALRMTPAERRSFDQLHRNSRLMVQRGDIEAYAAMNVSFHEALYAGSHNRVLADTAQSLRKRLAPFRRAQFQSVGRLADSYAEHDRVVAAILSADAAAAEAAMLKHVGKVADVSESMFEE